MIGSRTNWQGDVIIRKPSPTSIIACLALFLALGGSAIAANHYLITKSSQIKPSVLRKLKGNVGRQGPAGAPGAGGPQGPQGPAGPSNLSALVLLTGPEVFVPSGEVKAAVATCPPGQHAISGGGFNSITELGDSQMSSDHSSWFIIVNNESVIGVNVRAVVTCAGAGQAVAARNTSGAAHAATVTQAEALVAKLRTDKASDHR
jgi:hypothetical protein